MRKVNLGCGYGKLQGYINVDFNSGCNPDILHDLRKGLPFDNDSVDEIIAFDFLEHMPDFVSTMNEIGRVLKIGGKLITRFPPWNTVRAFSSNHALVLTYRDLEAFEPTSSKSYEYSISGEKLDKRFKVLVKDTVVGKCKYCPEGKHKAPKCHVIMEKIK